MRQLVDYPLSSTTSQAYDQPPFSSGRWWVERSAEEMSLGEPIQGVPGTDALAGVLSDTAAEPAAERRIEGFCGNPLRDEPHPGVTAAVRHFGLLGLMACAVGAGVLRLWRSVTRS